MNEHHNSEIDNNRTNKASKLMNAIIGANLFAVGTLGAAGLDLWAIKSFPEYKSPIVEGLLLIDQLIDYGKHKINLDEMKKNDFQEMYDIQPLPHEFEQKHTYEITSAHELYAALDDIGNKPESILEDSQFELHIPAGTTIVLKELTKASLPEQHVESQNYFSSNAAVVLPEGINILLSGDINGESRIVFPASEFGIVGMNMRDVQMENIYLERNGQSEPSHRPEESFRSLIYLTSNNKSDGLPYSASFFNVVLDNKVQSPVQIIEQSAVTLKDYNTVIANGLHVYDFYWDGIASFGTRKLQVTDSLFERNGAKLREGNAIVLVNNEADTVVEIQNVEVCNYLKLFGNFSDENGHLRIIDSDIYNDEFPSFWTFAATGRVDINGLRQHGFGSEFFSTGHNNGYITISNSSLALDLNKKLGFIDAEQNVEITRPFIDVNHPDFDFTDIQNSELRINGDSITSEQFDMLMGLGFSEAK